MTPSRAEIVSTVTAILARELGMSADALTPDLDLRAVEGADSVKVLVMISRIERTYDIEIEDEDVFALSSINDVVRIVLAALETAV
ncbi:acyl carrier protein [Frankia casuarinae]|uniref:Phosphopantetheine-binding n=1 Tax=Frankia casuarinae (strain DSM 45818 / CECT 9043 / HFP020203 / CcI3) TaxID=106370 RepID=Q2J5C3_FRACC|nr:MULTISPECIES: acyl carrier protein [Frankia]ABD13519.1 phosphopantetheine-binding [Frankia casuarinae]ETA00916.1 acyl carrier protein [Frankia sp. CcI6]EYT90706.1 acyl carrier protein [Frankia casuarinae]KDA41453.1 acyl carrier protein [Frankia sp. BMG5.23]KFB02998.1 acyl carrier protein [Frankia sp. Allo2]